MIKWLACAFVALAIAERRRPLRPRVDPEAARVGRNLATAAITAAITAALEKPLVDRALRATTRRQLGLLHRLKMPKPIRVVAGVLLLDYTLWWWHRLNHTLPPLWRFHVVHHIDRDLDVSTALRFHFGEMGLAAFFRAAQVRILGVDPEALLWWQRMLLVSILFHHSNLQLPENVERELVRFIVTPRMHGIHHSQIEAETNSNWSSLFSWWDRLHRTFIYDVPQPVIGAPGWEGSEDPGLGSLLAIPFRRAPEPQRSRRPAPSFR
ncbi:MAG: sterol desaturase family protein [Acidobacteriota bacterium]|nr:sterol desaturase family protein [Acidobacteriota bacterium]